MATNLVSLVTQFLTPDVIAKIASALGVDRSIAQKATGAAVPALLACLGNAVTKQGGERQLANALAERPMGELDNLKSIIGGSGESLVESGNALLSGLLGGSTQDSLTDAIGQYAGISGSKSRSLLGMLGPVVLGALGKQQRDTGLATSGLASLLASQKRQIAGAIPPGLADEMNASGLVDALGNGVRRRAASGASVAQMSHVADIRDSEPARWPYWVLGLAALAGLGWLLAQNWGEQRVAEQPGPTADRVVGGNAGRALVGVDPAKLTVNGVNLANEVNTSISALRTTLGGISDAASAQAALPKLEEVTTQLDDVNALAGQLPAESRSGLATLVAAAAPTINSMLEKILTIPGVEGVARPAIDELRKQLDSLAKA